MATPRVRGKYPEEYFTVFEKALEQGEFYLPVGDKSKAQRLRNRLYAFRRALQDSPEEDPKLAIIMPWFRFHLDAAGGLLISLWDQDTDIKEALNGT